MGTPHQITPATMVRSFDRPFLHAAHTGCGSSSAALWDWHLDQPKEITSKPDHEHHIVCFMTRSFRHDTYADGKLIYQGIAPSGTCALHRAATTPRAILYGSFGNFQVYLADTLVRRTAAEAGLDPASIELIDPALGHDPVLQRISDGMISAMRGGTPLSRLEFEHGMNGLTLRLLGRWSNISGKLARQSVPVRGGLAAWQLRRACDHLCEHLDRDIGLEELAQLVNLSATHLCTAFRQSTGLPPHQWQMRRRIERAQEMLLDRRQSVTDISLAVGYANPGHFATVFKRATGRSPRDWRRERLS